jgi:hypothetical protein
MHHSLYLVAGLRERIILECNLIKRFRTWAEFTWLKIRSKDGFSSDLSGYMRSKKFPDNLKDYKLLTIALFWTQVPLRRTAYMTWRKFSLFEKKFLDAFKNFWIQGSNKLQLRSYRLCPAARQVPITPKLICSILSPNFPFHPTPLSAQPHSSEFIILTTESSSFYFSLLLNSSSHLYEIMIYTFVSPCLIQ